MYVSHTSFICTEFEFNTYGTVVLIYTALGREFNMIIPWSKSPEDKQQLVDFLKTLPDFVSRGVIKPNPVKVVGSGFEGIEAGLNILREGKNSGEKLVVCISS